MPELRRLEPTWQTPEAPALPFLTAPVADVDENLAVEFYWVGATTRLAGTLVHRWLQMAAERRLDPGVDSASLIRPASERWLKEVGVSSESIPAIVDRVEEALRLTNDDEKGRWLIEGEGHTEFALSGIINDRVESVVLDRVRIDSDGTHWIVDYKTSSHEGGDLANFLSAETDRYRPQLAKYAEMYRNYSNADVRCALYFPLLQEFVEVHV